MVCPSSFEDPYDVLKILASPGFIDSHEDSETLEVPTITGSWTTRYIKRLKGYIKNYLNYKIGQLVRIVCRQNRQWWHD